MDSIRNRNLRIERKRRKKIRRLIIERIIMAKSRRNPTTVIRVERYYV